MRRGRSAQALSKPARLSIVSLITCGGGLNPEMKKSMATSLKRFRLPGGHRLQAVNRFEVQSLVSVSPIPLSRFVAGGRIRLQALDFSQLIDLELVILLFGNWHEVCYLLITPISDRSRLTP
jgi:hypothetical protein